MCTRCPCCGILIDDYIKMPKSAQSRKEVPKGE